MLFPENADKFGKFFFFELEDIFNFVQSYAGATPDDAILEIDISPETALNYVSVADYIYFDPTKSDENLSRDDIEAMENFEKYDYTYHHVIPELFINHNLIDAKIKSGDYHLISPDSILSFQKRPEAYFEKDRNPKTVELAKRLDEIWMLRLKINNLKAGFFDFSEECQKNSIEALKPVTDENQLAAELQRLTAELDSAIKGTISFFKDFAREHEKYMALVQVPER